MKKLTFTKPGSVKEAREYSTRVLNVVTLRLLGGLIPYIRKPSATGSTEVPLYPRTTPSRVAWTEKYPSLGNVSKDVS